MPTRWQNLSGAIWNGIAAKPQAFQVAADSTQNPTLDKNQRSPGTQVGFAQPVPAIGRPFNPLDMSPVNGRHWLEHLSSSYGTKVPNVLAVNPANVMMAVSREQDYGSVGPTDVWGKDYEIRSGMRKGYDPNNNYNQLAWGNGRRNIYS